MQKYIIALRGIFIIPLKDNLLVFIKLNIHISFVIKVLPLGIYTIDMFVHIFLKSNTRLFVVAFYLKTN